MATQSVAEQRRLIEKAGDMVVRLKANPADVDTDAINEALNMLSQVEQSPATEALREEAAEKLYQLNEFRSFGAATGDKKP